MCVRWQVLNEQRPSNNSFTHPEQSIPANISQTSEQLGIRPISAQQQQTVDMELALNDTLAASFHEQVRSDVRARCKNDTDLLPGRYPNTEKYFGNKKK